MYFCIKFFKKLNFNKAKQIILYKRSCNIHSFKFSKTNILIHRGLYSVLYTNLWFSKKLKFGMFSFTKKPFAKPEKKNSKKR